MHIKRFDTCTPAGRLWGIAAFALGLSLATNVIYVLKIGNTSVYIGYIVAVIVAFPLVLRDMKSGGPHLTLIDKSLWVFAFVCLLSVFPSIVSAGMGFVPDDEPLTVLKGLIVLICGVLVYYAVVSLESQRRSLIAGLAVGIAVNGVISVFQQVAFNSGSYFSLYTLFPQDAFSISAKWEIWSNLPVGAEHINVFRPQGLFLEASHLMVFLVCFAPFVFLSLRSTVAKAIVAVSAVYACATSMSPNSVFLIMEVLVLAFFVLSGRRFQTRLSETRLNPLLVLFVLAILLLSILGFVLKPEILINALNSIGRSLADLNISSTTDDGTLERWDSMLKALAAVSQFPFGAGWNTESQVLVFLYGSSDVASHSFVIRLLLELGVVGLVSYLYMMARHSMRLVAERKDLYAFALGVGVLFMLLCQAANGTSMVPWAWALLGLAQTEILSRGGEERGN